MDSKTKVGFIGFGNMGSAICDGLIKAEAVSTSNIFACANNWDKLLKEAESRQIKACKNAEELVKNADMIVVAVKPNMVEKVLESVKNEIKGKIIVSIAAGCNADFYEKLLGSEYNYIATKAGPQPLIAPATENTLLSMNSTVATAVKMPIKHSNCSALSL